MNTTQIAGGVVINGQGKILVVSQGDSWSLPKGHVDNDETLEEAAVREIYEESGIRHLDLIKKLGTYQRYRIGKNGCGEDKSELKNITVFVFTTSEIKLSPVDPKNPEAIWAEIDNVPDLLTHKKDKEFFRKSAKIIKDII